MSNPTSPLSTWQRLALLLILLLTAWLNFWNIAIEGYANLYYAAGVYSMGQNWHNFLFNSFDPAGFVTIDKPPLGLWLQVLSTKILGFTGWALIFPQALAGVLAVALIFHLVRRTFGVNAGLLAALTLAVTPISVAASRNNTMDSVLVLTLLLAAWAVMLAAERGQLRWLLLCALLVGLGFEIKMLQAYMVLPAFYLVYFFTAKITWFRRLWHLTLASLVIVVVSLAWPLAVDFTPAENRPYVGSSKDNTVMELIIGHNGAARMGQMAGLAGVQVGDNPGARAMPQGNLPPRGMPPAQLPARPPVNGPGQNPPGQALPANPQQPQGSTPPGGGMQNETGQAGPLRLFNRQLAGQSSWFLPLALLFSILIPLAFWHPRLLTFRFILLWAGWLIPQAVFFSYAGLFHRYYLMMLAPAIAALVGAGSQVAVDAWRLGGWWRCWLPAAGIAVVVTQVGIIAAFPTFAVWLIPALLLAAVILLALGYFFRHRRRLVAVVNRIMLVPLFLAPFIWSLIPVVTGGHSGLPYAGPELLEAANINRGSGNNLSGASRLANYLLEHQGQAVYVAAAQSAQQASPLILLTGQPVMAFGGFSGGDNILSVDDFAKMVSAGQVRFVLTQNGPQVNQQPGTPAQQGNNRQQQNLPPNGPQQSAILQWAVQNCSPVKDFPLLDCATLP